jgi:hypothetical protein
MIRLLDYLDYLNNEIIQARKRIDERAVNTAKEYSQNEYLQHFRAPKYSMPSIKLDIPLKIADIDAQTKYDFKLIPKEFLKEVNEKISNINQEKDLKIPPISIELVSKPEFEDIFKNLESRDQRFVRNLESEIAKFDFQKPINEFLTYNVFQPQKITTVIEKSTLSKIFSDVIMNQYRAVSVKLNEIYFDPDTSKETDKDKLFVNLHLEMVEEGIRIVRFKDANGNEMEQITVE